jgi:methyl coenzyme M reductase subunit C
MPNTQNEQTQMIPEEIIQINESTLAVVPPAPEHVEYTMDEIIQECDKYTIYLQNMQSQADVWFARRDKALELGLKTTEQIQKELDEQQTLEENVQVEEITNNEKSDA